jgi:hypothetical protein
MSSTFQPLYATSAGITISLASLGDGAARECTAIDNTSNKYTDAHVYLAIKLATGTPGNNQVINVYAYGSEDGTNYGDNVTGSDAALTMRSPTNLRIIGCIQTPASGALTWKSHPMSVARAFGGVLPRKWGIVVENLTGLAFDSTEGNHTKTFTGINIQGT